MVLDSCEVADIAGESLISQLCAWGRSEGF